MSALWLANIVVYSLHLTAIVVTALIATRLVPLRHAIWRFRFWQGVLIVAMVLPMLAFRGDAASATAGSLLFSVTNVPATGRMSVINMPRVVVLALLAGAFIRLVWLAFGYVATWRMAGRATSLGDVAAGRGWDIMLERSVDVRISTEVRCPATLGFRQPVILIPPELLDLPDTAARRVIAHELVHVRRGDWLRMLIEELWCAVLWFHPLARALVARVDLSREMLVDEEVVRTLGGRRAYAHALLMFAGTPSGIVSRGTYLIRPRHLSQRLIALTQEVPMSRRPTYIAFSALSAVVVGTTAAAAWAIPMPGLSGSSIAPRLVAATQGGDVAKPGDGVTLPKVIFEARPEIHHGGSGRKD